jgi:uncharacterized damage-inducible protein DinB
MITINCCSAVHNASEMTQQNRDQQELSEGKHLANHQAYHTSNILVLLSGVRRVRPQQVLYEPMTEGCQQLTPCVYHSPP